MIDILAIGAHPDDVETGCAGFIVKAKKDGLSNGIIILTKGEAGAFANASTRIEEAKEAAKIMGIDYFKIMDFKDCGIEDTVQNASVLATVIRELRPKIILAPWEEDFHPDHMYTSKLVDRAIFIAGRNNDSKGIWEPKQTFYFSLNFKNLKSPDMIIDITDVYEIKKKALMTHKSQFMPLLTGVEFLSRYYGALNGCTYGEGFICKNPVKINTVGSLI